MVEVFLGVKMIAYLKGLVDVIDKGSCILDVNGVGYELTCSSNTLDALLTGEKASLHVYTHVKEDVLQLFGFINKFEKDLFLSLNKVNGIGPKMAALILSGASPDTIHQWIEAGDAKSLSSLPKVGKKKAEQIVLSLKGKLIIEEHIARVTNSARGEIRSALLNLGFKMTDIDFVMTNLTEEISVEEGIRESLQSLTAGV